MEHHTGAPQFWSVAEEDALYGVSLNFAKKKKKKVGGSISLLFSNFFFFLFKLPTFGRVHVANCAFSLAGVKDKVSAFTSNCLALHQHHHKCDI